MDNMDTLWKNGISFNYVDKSFKDFENNEIPDAMCELYCDYGPLSSMCVFRQGACDTFIREIFATK